MTNKTDKEITEEFEKFGKEHYWDWNGMPEPLVAFLKQALSRKEEEMIELFAQALVVNIPEDMAGQVMAYKHCLSQIKENLSNKGIEL